MTFDLTHNGSPVPWTTPWTGEETGYSVVRSKIAGGHFVLSQKSAMGEGRPIFGGAHMDRQRQAVIQGRCDVCGGMIRQHQARVLLHPGNRLTGTDDTGHVMAPCHRACARQSAQVCPWLIRQIEAGELVVTVVKKADVALAQLDPEIVESETGQWFDFPVFGHAKLIVRAGMTRDAEWLMREATS
ncbi:hypothetical protein [Actibacterium sp. MT2.3-13A]|uniref:hypothetical protein n=1 Tax=Actibacterium sp. MT2.3-13A TaxID=2828332 RepID=UPI001BA4BCC0|nr:hypothetical protein [Actibacterium sp. MT2.3-13A]